MADKILDICKSRRSVRNFTGEPISDRQRDYFMEAARWAATSRDLQSRRFVYLDDPESIDGIVRQAQMQEFVADAGILIFGLATDREYQGAISDVIISMTQLEMAAVECGLGTIWLGVWERSAVRRLLKVPDHMKIVVGMAIGHPADEGKPERKMPVDELFKKDVWKQ